LPDEPSGSAASDLPVKPNIPGRSTSARPERKMELAAYAAPSSPRPSRAPGSDSSTVIE
jgi:hypothetical protein